MQESPPDKLPHIEGESLLLKCFRVRWLFLYWIAASLIVAFTYEGESFSAKSVVYLFFASLLILMLQFFVVGIIPLLVRLLSKKLCSEGVSLLIAFGVLTFKGWVISLFLGLNFGFLGDNIFSEWGETLQRSVRLLIVSFNYPDTIGATIQHALWWISVILESIFYFIFLLYGTVQSETKKEFILSRINVWTVIFTGGVVLLLTALTYPGRSVGQFIQWNLIYFGFNIMGVMILPCVIRLFRKKNCSPQASVIITGICLFSMRFFSVLSMLFAIDYLEVLADLQETSKTYEGSRDALIGIFHLTLLLLAYKVLRSPIGLAVLFGMKKTKKINES